MIKRTIFIAVLGMLVTTTQASADESRNADRCAGAATRPCSSTSIRHHPSIYVVEARPEVLSGSDRDRLIIIDSKTNWVIDLEGKPLRFDRNQQPVFGESDIEKSLRLGFAKYARTEEGKAMIEEYGSRKGVEIRFALVPGTEETLGTTRPAAGNSFAEIFGRDLIFVVTLNSTLEGIDIGNARPIGHAYPSRTSDLRALQIGAEILHVDFFARGFKAGTHHSNDEFQARWAALTKEMGSPGFPHHD